MFRHIYRTIKNVKFKNLAYLTSPLLAASFVHKDQLRKIELTDPQKMTHSFLIQQASSIAVNAASQLLTQTVVAILDTAELYKNTLTRVLSILEESKTRQNQILEDELNDLLIAARSEANIFKNELFELVSLMEYVEKVAESTAEASYLIGAEYVSTSMGEALYAAKNKVEQAKKEIDVLEQELLNIQKDLIIGDKN